MKLRVGAWVMAWAVGMAAGGVARGTTYRWGSGSGNFSDGGNWVGGLGPAAAGSAGDVVVLPGGSDAYTVTLDQGVGYRLNSLSLGTANASAVTLQGVGGSGLIFDGANSVLSVAPTSGFGFEPTTTISVPLSTTGDLTIRGGGGVTVAGALSSTGGGRLMVMGGTALNYQNNAGLSGVSSVVIQGTTVPDSLDLSTVMEPSVVVWNYAAADGAPVAASFGSGTITLQDGSFRVNVVAPITALTVVGNSPFPPLVSLTGQVAIVTPPVLPHPISLLMPINVNESPTIGSMDQALEALEAAIGAFTPHVVTLPTRDVVQPSYGRVEVDIGNAIVVIGSGTLGAAVSEAPVPAADFGVAATTKPTGLVRFTGPLRLNGTLTIEGDSFSIGPSVAAVDLAGTMSLDQTGGQQPVLNVPFLTLGQPVTLSGNIVDGAAAAGPIRPLVIEGPSAEALLTLSGKNTYSAGTILEVGDIFVTTNSSLGTGSVMLEWGTLHLGALTNVAAGRKILLEGPQASVAIQFDADPSQIIDSNSMGTAALDTVFTTPLNEATLGNGTMALGSSNGGVYAATTLGAGVDHVYRFAAPNSSVTGDNCVLTILHSVLVDNGGVAARAELGGVILEASNSYSGGTTITDDVWANASGALGTGDVGVGNPDLPGLHTLYLSVANGYSAKARVDVYGILAFVGANGVMSADAAPPVIDGGGVLVLGDGVTNNGDRYPDGMALGLRSSTVHLKGVGTTTEAVGAMTVSGCSSVVLENPATGSAATTLATPSLTLAPHAVLFMVPLNGAWSSGATSNVNVAVGAGLASVNGMVTPAIQMRDQLYNNYSGTGGSVAQASFMNYSAGRFSLATYTTMPTDGGTGTEIVDIPQDQTGGGPLVLANDTHIYAVRTQVEIDNPSSRAVTLGIGSGGFIVQAPEGSGMEIQPSVDFGGEEAFINVASYGTWSSPVTLSGVVTATGGLTKVGQGSLVVANEGSRIGGMVTVWEGSLTLPGLPVGASVTLGGGATLNFASSVEIGESFQVMDGAAIGYNTLATVTVPSGQQLTLKTPVACNDPLSFGGGGVTAIDAPLTTTSNISLYGGEVQLRARITCQNLRLDGNVTGCTVVDSYSNVSIEDGVLAPGDGAGQMGVLRFETPRVDFIGTGMRFDLDGTGHSDEVEVTGLLFIYGNGGLPWATLDLNFMEAPEGAVYTLIEAGELEGAFGAVVGLPGGYAVDYSVAGEVRLVPVPEAGTLGLLGVGAGLGVRRRGRKVRV